MKKLFSGLLAALFVIVSAVCASGGEAPVVVTHTLTGYTKTDREVTLDYVVQVQNRDNTPVVGLTLSLAPRVPFEDEKAKLSVERLGPKASANLRLKVVTRRLHDRSYFSGNALLWAGRYTDGNGRVVEFPTKSMPGGAK